MKFKNRNVIISPKAKIGQNVRIGDDTVIYDNVEIGDNSIIANNCIIGEPNSDYYYTDDYENESTVIGSGSLIRSHCILYSGSIFGKKFITGHRVTIREKTKIGDYCRVGTLSDIQGDCTIGNYVWLHSNVHIGQKSQIENFVMIYPYVVLTNDPTPPSNKLVGVHIKSFAQIAVFSVLLPGVEIGEHSLIGAQSTVDKSVAPFSLTLGSPAKHIKDVREIMSRENGQPHYPWPMRFDRGMPWEGIGFKKWKDEK